MPSTYRGSPFEAPSPAGRPRSPSLWWIAATRISADPAVQWRQRVLNWPSFAALVGMFLAYELSI